MTEEKEADIDERRKANALALAQLIYDIYQSKQREEDEDEVS